MATGLELLLFAGVPAGVVVAGAASGGTPASTSPTKIAPGGGILGTAGALSPGSTVDMQLRTEGRITTGGSPAYNAFVTQATSPPIAAFVNTPRAVGDNAPRTAIDSQLQAKLAEVERYAKAAYTNLDGAAKKKGADTINKALKLDPPLSGDESWEDLAKITGGAAGVAVFGWAPGGVVWGPIVGSYLGVKLEELVNKNLDEIKSWFKGRWSDIESWVEGVGDKIESAARDVIDYIGGWF